MTSIAQPVLSSPFVTGDTLAGGASPSMRRPVTTSPGPCAPKSSSHFQPLRHHQNLLRVPCAEVIPFQIPSSSSDVQSASVPSQNLPGSLAGCGDGGTKRESAGRVTGQFSGAPTTG